MVCSLDASVIFFHTPYKNYKKTSCKILLLHFIVCNLNLLTTNFISNKNYQNPLLYGSKKEIQKEGCAKKSD